MSKDILGNKIADTSVSIPKEEYEALLRETETLRLLIKYIVGESIVTVSTIKVLLGLNEPPKED